MQLTEIDRQLTLLLRDVDQLTIQTVGPSVVRANDPLGMPGPGTQARTSVPADVVVRVDRLGSSARTITDSRSGTRT